MHYLLMLQQIAAWNMWQLANTKGIFTPLRSFAEYWKHFVACFNDVHASGYNSAGSERIWMKFGVLGVYCLELAMADFGRDPRRSKSWTAKFFCPVINARLYRFPVSQISRNLHTRRGSERWWILSENIFENLPIKGLFYPKRSTFAWTSSMTLDFRPRYLRNHYKSWKVTTGWHAYGMLALHLYHWNQLSHSPGLQAAYKKQHSWTLPALPSGAADLMSQSHSHGGANNLTLTLHYC